VALERCRELFANPAIAAAVREDVARHGEVPDPLAEPSFTGLVASQDTCVLLFDRSFLDPHDGLTM
jgi:hypothetical protein